MTSVRIFHANRRGSSPLFDLVAEVNTGGLHGESALDFAYERTQNIHGSWSMPSRFDDGMPNNDHNVLVKVLAPLPVFDDGLTYGLRSSDVGDVFVLDGSPYLVAGVGFEPLPAGHSFARMVQNQG